MSKEQVKDITVKTALIACVLLCAALVMTVPTDSIYAALSGSYTGTQQYSWERFGSTSGANGLFPGSASTPGVCTEATMIALTNAQIHKIDEDWSGFRIRSSSTVDADTTVYDLYVAEKDGVFYRLATLTFTTGTGSNPAIAGLKFADTLVETNWHWHKDSLSTNPTGDFIAIFAVDGFGVDKVALVPTSITTTAFAEIIGVNG